MTLSLPQGGNAALAQADPSARTLFIGLHWQWPATASPVEIDASLFLLDAAGVVRDDRDFVFYNQETDASGAAYRLPAAELDPARDRDGFVVSLPALSEDVRRLACCLSLDATGAGDATFGAVTWVQARVVNHDSGQELFHYRCGGELGAETALVVAELYRHRDGWKFRAVGQGFAGGLRALAAHFGVLVADEESPSANLAAPEGWAFTAPTLASTAVAVPHEDDASSHLGGVKDWIVRLFVRGIQSCSTEQDRLEAIAWFALAREILNDSQLSATDKAGALYRLMSFKSMAQGVLRGVRQAVKNYRDAPLPRPLKVAIPVTLAAAAVVGGQGAGVVAFGGGIGVPVLLLLFLGTAGLTAVLEAVLGKPQASSYLTVVLALLARDAALLKAKAWLREAMAADLAEPKHQKMPEDESALRARLWAMDPFVFEQHVMSFFQQQGLIAWVTQKSNDGGVDGFARHRDGLIVVQCKRYAADKPVGSATVRQLKGVVEENQAWRGYLVTTSVFSKPAQDSASTSDKIILVDMDALVGWHRGKMPPI